MTLHGPGRAVQRVSGRHGLRIHTRYAVLVSIRWNLSVACASGMHSGMPSQSLHFSLLAGFCYSSFWTFSRHFLSTSDQGDQYAWTANSRWGLTYCAYSLMNTCLPLYVKARDSCPNMVWAVLAALWHWPAGFRFFVNLPPMSISPSVTISSCPFIVYFWWTLLCPKCIPHLSAQMHRLSRASCMLSLSCRFPLSGPAWCRINHRCINSYFTLRNLTRTNCMKRFQISTSTGI